MSSYRLASNHDSFVRDLIRDLCAVYVALAEQNRRNRLDGTVSYSGLHALIGESMRKGVFWRLKDTAHHLFRHTTHSWKGKEKESYYELVGNLVDWCIGYAFHECCKLREDAFQGQHYATRLSQLVANSEEAPELASTLLPLTGQTEESSRRELTRILHVLRSAMALVVRILPSASSNCCLARWIAMEQEQVQHAFGHLYGQLIQALYGLNPQHMFTLAASDFLDCGRVEEAHSLLSKAREEGNIDSDGLLLLFTIEKTKEISS